MPNTIRTIFTARTRFALLALGAISLSGLTLPAMAGDDAPDGGATNASTCRDVVNHSCLTKPRDDQSSNNQDTKNSNYSRELSIILKRDDDQSSNNQGTRNPTNPGANTRDATTVDLELQTIDNLAARAARAERNWQNLLRQGNTTATGGKGGAAGHTGSRIAPPGARTSGSAAAPKAATPKSTTTNKATNTTTRDYRTGATAAPGGPPPAAASGSSTKATPEQLAAQSGTRDHRH